MSETFPESVFDPRWLDDLAAWCRRGKDLDEALEDLYLERRLELRLHAKNGIRWLEECRTEGTAARWRSEGRVEIEAVAGTLPRTVAHLLQDRFETREIRLHRPFPPPELDVPRGWRDEAERLLDACPTVDMTLRLLLRRAAVVRPDTWHEVRAPLLVRIEAGVQGERALLTAWDHPPLASLASAIEEKPAPRPWRPTSGESVPVIFSAGTAGVLLHEIIGHLLEADLLIAGDSPFSPENPERVGPAGLEVTDDPTRFDLPGAFSCDDEGVPAQAVPLLEDGVVAGALCDRHSAPVLGSPPGRARRASWSAPPVPRLSNLLVRPGTTAPEAFEADVRAGIIVTRIAGASVDPRSARLVIRVDRGWEIRSGRRRRPLAPFSLTGEVLEVLAGIDPNIGDDPTSDLNLGWCVKGGLPLPTGSEAPTMSVRSMEVL